MGYHWRDIGRIGDEGHTIILSCNSEEFKIYDTINEFGCRFPKKHIKKILTQFRKWSTELVNEIQTGEWGNKYNYVGNWVETKRIPLIIQLLTQSIEVKRRTKSELKRLATSTIIAEYNMIRGLLGDDTKKRKEVHA